MVRGLTPVSHPLHDSRSSRWEGGQKKCPGDGGRCHCIDCISSYGAEILIKEEWREIQIQGAQKKQQQEWQGRRKTERP